MSAKRQLLQALKSAEATVEALKQALQLLEWDDSDESGNAATADNDDDVDGEAATVNGGIVPPISPVSTDADDARASLDVMQIVNRRKRSRDDASSSSPSI